MLNLEIDLQRILILRLKSKFVNVVSTYRSIIGGNQDGNKKYNDSFETGNA